MRKFSNKQVFRTALLAGSASMMAVASPAFAQNMQDEEPAAEPSTRIVVTGSRIASQDFESNSPMVTIDEAFLENFGTAAIEQNLNRLPQFVPAQTPFAGGDIQPTATNTPGAATVSLRGIGSNRNLVLIDGRRGTPANASGVIDINTIPFAAIERVESISGGASATYGADAIAGVTNFILKKNFVGLELDAQAAITQEGDNFEYQLSGIMGADFDDGRGNISVAMSMNTREANFRRDRDYWQEDWANPNTTTGAQFFPDPFGVNFGFGNLPDFSTAFSNGADGSAFVDVPIDPDDPNSFLTRVRANGGAAGGQTVFFQDNGNPFQTGFGQVGLDNYQGPTDGNKVLRTASGSLAWNNTDLYLVLPLTRYNMFARGNYEINDWIGVFATGLFSHTETYTLNEPGPIVGGWGVNIDPTTLDPGQLPDSMQALIDSRTRLAGPGDPGYITPIYNTPGDPTSGLDPNVQQPLQPVVSAADAPFLITGLLPEPRETYTDVMTYNLTAGLEGFIPGTSFSWEAFVNHGVSTTFANQTGIYSLERMRTVLNSGNFGQGFSQQGNAAFGGFGASTGTCTSGLNFFNPPAGGFSEDCLEAVSADLKNRSKMEQTIAQANITGGLFDLPAGEVGIALGASYWELDFEFLNDTLTTQGRSFQDQALGIYPSGNSFGAYNVHELYGEMLIPLLSDLPAIEQLNLEIGGRISDFSTTGTSYTYKILGDWEVTDFLRIRGGFNRAERAPNIGELFLAPQQTFGANNVGDLCSKNNPLSFSANEATNPNGANVEAVCRVLMEQSGDPVADDFYYQQNADGVYINGAGSTATGGFAFPTVIGNPNLTPETANTWTAGVVINSPFTSAMFDRFRLSVDWFRISVDDAIGVQSVGVAQRQCLQPEFNPLVLTDPTAAANSQFCQQILRNAESGALGNTFLTYVNNGRFNVEGIDFALDWGFDVGPGTVNLNTLINYQIAFESAELPTDPLVDFVGTNGVTVNGLNAGAYEYRALTTLGYRIGGLNLSLQWQHLPRIDDSALAQFGTTASSGLPAYNVFFLNSTYAVTDDVTVRFGIDNLFNQEPPFGNVNVNNTSPETTGQLPQGSRGGAFYDLNGRRAYLGLNMRF